jgi:hypothetical protein
LYVEKLSIRPVWWAVALAVSVLAAAELAAGFDWRIGLGALATTAGVTAGVLAGVSRPTLRVDATGLSAGGRTMTYDEMESVEALDREQTRQRVGPQGDPRAYLVFRGYIAETVLVRPLRPEPTPYWLVSTRRPQAVVAAVEQAARASLGR